MNRFETNRAGRKWLITPQRMVLLAIIACAVGTVMTSRHWEASTRAMWREAIRPGLLVIDAVDSWRSQAIYSLQPSEQELQQTQVQVVELREQLRRRDLQLQLAASNRTDKSIQLASVTSAADKSANDEFRLPPLVNCQTVSARVLGGQAQAFLQARDVLDIGQSRGISAKSLVIDASEFSPRVPLLDQGRDAALGHDRLVLSGRRVWGKVADVGAHTSTVLRVVDSGYRDLVQLANRREGRLHFTTRGVLVGRGESLCKIELVGTGESVTVGDLVFTADDGILDAPLLYGSVQKVERKAGAANWEIWMQPAITSSRPPAEVAVLKMELNSARFAGSQDSGIKVQGSVKR